MIVFHSWCHEDHLTFSYKLLTFPQLYQRIVLYAQWFCRVLWGVILWQIVENCCCSTTPLISNATSIYHCPNHIHHVSSAHQERKENVLFLLGSPLHFETCCCSATLSSPNHLRSAPPKSHLLCSICLSMWERKGHIVQFDWLLSVKLGSWS